ncbi:hypothetical protein LX36DRAFT_15770 [Colletotrichum falcatum]|nr:hypothetical protein LX36DRAFT_15770 [Colletotrichum falcatum]
MDHITPYTTIQQSRCTYLPAFVRIRVYIYEYRYHLLHIRTLRINHGCRTTKLHCTSVEGTGDFCIWVSVPGAGSGVRTRDGYECWEAAHSPYAAFLPRTNTSNKVAAGTENRIVPSLQLLRKYGHGTEYFTSQSVRQSIDQFRFRGDSDGDGDGDGDGGGDGEGDGGQGDGDSDSNEGMPFHGWQYTTDTYFYCVAPIKEECALVGDRHGQG